MSVEDVNEYFIDHINGVNIRYVFIDGYWYWQEDTPQGWLPSLKHMASLPILYGCEDRDAAVAQAKEVINARGNV